MSTERPFPGEMHQLLDRLVDGTISDEQRSQLDEALRSHPELLEYFLDYCQLHIDLAIDLRADQALELFRERQQQVAAPLGVDECPFTAPSTGQAYFGFSGFFSLGIAACALMLVAVVGLWWWIGERRTNDRAPLPIARAPAATMPQVNSIKINSGSSKLDLAGIGTVIVEGPADFELKGPMRARLNHGRIKVHVTQESGRGFVVETPDGEVTDLGTEFGLDVADQPGTGLAVFQGKVDLRLGDALTAANNLRVEHLFGGDGVRFSKIGQLDRIMSIVTQADGTFRMEGDPTADSTAVITRVTDNIHTGDTKKFYEIVRGGMREDALAYVDRQHEWNGISKKGMPEYLIGADYVKPFNSDKARKDLELEITIGRPARLFLIIDERIQPPPEWLEKADFARFGDRLGLDMGTSYAPDGTKITRGTNGIGPGQSVNNNFAIWVRDVPEPGRIKLGAGATERHGVSMYGIAATPLNTEAENQGK